MNLEEINQIAPAAPTVAQAGGVDAPIIANHQPLIDDNN